jgi:hypothetical protein
MTSGVLPADHSLDDVVVRIRKTYSNPNVRTITQVVLKEGPRAFRIATLLELINPATDEFHHYSLKLDQINRTKAGWFAKPEKSIRLEGKEPDEIEKLYRFLHAAYENRLSGEAGALHVIRGEDYVKLEVLVKALPNLAATDKLHLVKNLLAQLSGDDSTVSEFVSVFEGSTEATRRSIAAASRLVDYRKALAHLKEIVDNSSTPEHDFQQHLERNPWMFGSEYSELLSRRAWTRDERVDYMLRRTVDNYLEIVEIKTAFTEPLFIYDDKRDCYYPSAKLSPIFGQITKYIEEVERQRDHILAKDNVDTLKIRARAILGRDQSAEEQAALHKLNAHLHGIEILTFDQLVRIAERVLAIFETTEATALLSENEDDYEYDDDIPF